MEWYASKSVDSGNNTGWNISTGFFWYAYNSVDSGNNDGWIFVTVSPTVEQNASRDENGVPTLLAAANVPTVSTVRIHVDPDTHALIVNGGTTGNNYGPTNAYRDENFVPVLLAVSSVDGETPIAVYGDPDTGALLIDGL